MKKADKQSIENELSALRRLFDATNLENGILHLRIGGLHQHIETLRDHIRELQREKKRLIADNDKLRSWEPCLADLRPNLDPLRAPAIVGVGLVVLPGSRELDPLELVNERFNEAVRN